MPEKDIQWIMERLPHRYPLLLLDRVIELEPDVRIVALKNVTINEEFFQGHFPGLPVMPGVLILEAMAQAGGLMVLPEDGSAAGKNFFLVTIDNAKFRRTVVPGDQLRVTVTLSKNGRIVNGQGADTDIVVASAKAYINALNKLHSKIERINPQL